MLTKNTSFAPKKCVFNTQKRLLLGETQCIFFFNISHTAKKRIIQEKWAGRFSWLNKKIFVFFFKGGLRFWVYSDSAHLWCFFHFMSVSILCVRTKFTFSRFRLCTIFFCVFFFRHSSLWCWNPRCSLWFFTGTKKWYLHYIPYFFVIQVIFYRDTNLGFLYPLFVPVQKA